MTHIGKHNNISIDIRSTADDCDHDELMAAWPIILEGPDPNDRHGEATCHIFLTLPQARDLLRFLGCLGEPVDQWRTCSGPGLHGDYQLLFVHDGRVYLAETPDSLEIGSLADAARFAGYIRGAIDFLVKHPRCWAMQHQAAA